MVDDASTSTLARRRRRQAIPLVAVVAVLAVQHLGPAPAAAETFTNPEPIVIVGLGPTGPDNTPATPYPSNIEVTGMTGTITDVNLTLNGIDCSARTNDFAYPEDFDILLESPSGDNAVVYSDVGGNNGGDNNAPPFQFPAIDVTLDDEAAQPLPADSQLSAGTYRPVDDDNDPGERVPVDTFPTTGPTDPENPPTQFITPTGATALSTFDGEDPNGTWSLYVVDDYPGPDNCEITNGWTIDITTGSTPPTSSTSSTSTSSTSTSSTSTSSTSTSSTSTSTTSTTTPAPTTTSTPAPTTTSTPAPTTTSTPASTTTSTPAPGGPVQIDDLVLSDGDVARVTGTITCQAGDRYRMRLILTQDGTDGRALINGNCTGEPQRFRAIIQVRSGPGFEDGTAQARATGQVGDPDTGTILDRFDRTEEVEIDVRGGMAAAALKAAS